MKEANRNTSVLQSACDAEVPMDIGRERARAEMVYMIMVIGP
jgi:hypothetical protein